MSKSNTKTNAAPFEHAELGDIATDILNTGKTKPMSKINKDALLASTASIGAEWKDASKTASDKRISANDLAFLFVVHLIALFSNSRNKTATLWPGRGGIRKVLNAALKDVGIKKKAADRFMAVASILEMHMLAVPANSTVKQVQHACQIYGWNSVSQIKEAFVEPLAWNEDCEDSLQRYIPLIEEDCQHHEDKGAKAIEDEAKLVSKRYFDGMDKADKEQNNTAERKTILPFVKQKDVYDKAQQKAQLAEIQKQAKQ